MHYFLDFDRTLFDTERFLSYLFAKPECAGLSKPPHKELAADLDALVRAGALSFQGGELAQFLFPDVADFIARHECTLVTAGPAEWQKAKVESALQGARVFYTGGNGHTPKGPVVLRAMEGLAGPFCFADDHPVQLESVASSVPAVRVFEMVRYGGAGTGKYPLVRSLAELP